MLRLNIHRHLAEIEIRADPGRGRDPGRLQHIQNHRPGQLPGAHPIRPEIGRGVNEHLVNGIDMHILRRDVLQIDLIDPAADLHVARHLRRGGHIVKGKRRIGPEFRIPEGRTGKPASGRLLLPQGVHLPHLLHHLKEPRPPGDPVRLEGRGYRQTDGLLRAAYVRHDQIGGHGIQPPVHAFHRRIK